jgi:Domain of unknown function (DUF5916)
MKYLITALFVVAFSGVFRAQVPNIIPKKYFEASRSQHTIKIDGVLDDAAWQDAGIAGDFVQNEPQPGAGPTYPTQVKVVYDNAAIYIGALLHDSRPDSILKEMSERDQLGNTDWFAVVIDAYRDGNNGVGFIVTPAGIQFDTKFSAGAGYGGSFGGVVYSGQRSWDAVWDSEARITEDGWVVEMEIPYSAMRFPNTGEQVWHINFARQIRRHRETSYWNEVNPDISGYLNQSGEIGGISGIKSPVRLSATPFLSVYAQNYYDKNNHPKSSWGRSFNGGMDIKYGINDAFTLDMTLIPDFGQVRSDNEVLNLSPFEVRYDENRQFFTEGTELFSKGRIFYSRRVGGRPLHSDDVYDGLGENEEVVSNPAESQLINATKISGRTNKGLGLGFFNAVSAKTKAAIRNVETGDEREVTTAPLSNYNILVLDQNLKNNSYLSFINTSVLRQGDDYDANVTGSVFSFRNKPQSYALNGKLVVSQKYFTDTTALGHTFFTTIDKTSGKFRWALGYSQESAGYDINDLGFLRSPNDKVWSGGLEYNKNEPFARFNEAHVNMDVQYRRLYSPDAFSDFAVELESWAQTRKLFTFGFFSRLEPVETFDFFEPRTDDFSRYYRYPTSFNIGGWASTDFRKKFALNGNFSYRHFYEDGRRSYNFRVSPRLRANDRLSFSLRVRGTISTNDVGYVITQEDGGIVFGIRDNVTVENVFNTNYIFTNRMSLSFRLRHYWSKAEYSSFGLLDKQGRLAGTTYDDFSDNSFNAFTIDAVYRWRFAPGSDIYIVWKNNTSSFSNEDGDVLYSYEKGVRSLTDLPQSNSLSLKIIYYLDYLNLKKA